MCKRATVGHRVAGAALILLTTEILGAQVRPDWRHIGNAAIDFSLPSVATGPVDRVWYSSDGTELFARTQSGAIYVTRDFERWQKAGPDVAEPAPSDAPVVQVPEVGSTLRVQSAVGGRIYAMGRFVYRSEDGGSSWTNLTGYRGLSILGGGLTDLAISPQNEDEVVVASDYGVWRSMDGGASWSGLNQMLPNLPVRRLVGLVGGGRGVRVALDGPDLLAGAVVEWAPGEKLAWRPAEDTSLVEEANLRRTLSSLLPATVTTVAVWGDFIYAGTSGGRLAASSDSGRSWTWMQAQDGAGAITRIWVSPEDPRLALAAAGSKNNLPAGVRPSHVLKTQNGGAFWDDLTANLPDGAANGITADRSTGAVYVATDRGLFLTYTDLSAAAPASAWTPVQGLPSGRVEDVRLDANGNQLYVAVDGYGVYAADGPHRVRSPRLVNAADFSSRAAAPGSLVSVIGSRVETAQAGDLNVPVLAASDSESQIQVPFEATGSALTLALKAETGRWTLGLPLQPASPAIFIDRDGTPLVLDGDSGVVLDAMTPAHSNSRIQILATGLGRVKPDWPTGLAAPLENPPTVIAAVRAFLDGNPVQVTRAVLAPGYIGFYLVDVELPKIVNSGSAELYLEVDGHDSNRVRVYIDP